MATKPVQRWLWLGLALMLVAALLEGPQPGHALVHGPRRRFYRRAIRLCSKSLSDALFLLCKDRGYNEPFAGSGESQTTQPNGPGLVEECCYNACSLEQMEQYCKPKP